MSRACVVWVTATVACFVAALLGCQYHYAASSLWLNVKSGFAFTGILSAVVAVPWCELREPDTELELPDEYDAALTRMCPDNNCRTVVVDQPITRCPSCWTQL